MHIIIRESLPMNRFCECEKKLRRKQKIKRRLIAALIALNVFFVYVYFSAVNLIFYYGGKDYQYYISNCSYYAVRDCIKQNFDFSRVCEVDKNSAGDVVFIKTDALYVNYISQKLALDCYGYLSDYIKNGVNVPLGTFSGIRLIAGFGKPVNIKLTATLSVECRIYRKFEAAGINQTRQVLSAIIHSDITAFALFKSEYYGGDIEVTLYDNLIVGKVPEVYLGGGLLSSSVA